MKKVILIIALFSIVSLSAQEIYKTTTTTVIIIDEKVDEEKEAIKKVIQTAYVEGLQNEGDTDKIDLGIHPDFNLLGIGKNNKMWKYSITDWKADVVKKRDVGALPFNGKDKVTIQFKNIDITGTAAVAKIEFFVGTKLTYVDYISLYKFDNGWKMVNKIFYKI